MKTIIFFGASRKKGHTNTMIEELVKHLHGEVEIIDAYRVKNIGPCLDCRYCWKVKGCAVKDGMQEIYEKIEHADNIVFASPMYFHSVTGQLKTLIDRLQVYWAGHGMRKDAPDKNIRKGGILMVGGAPTFENQFLGGEIVLRNVLKDLSTECTKIVTFPNSDAEQIQNSPDTMAAIKELAGSLNGQS